MKISLGPTGAQLSGSHTISIEPLPPHPEAVEDFLSVQRQVSLDTYTGMPCMTQDNRPSHITEEDLATFFDPHDVQAIEYLTQMAETNFDPKRELGCVLLRAVDIDQERTIATLNLKFGGIATVDNPASAMLHDIAVSRGYQRRGIGALLLRTALTAIGPHHKASDIISLRVVSSNEPAKAWYDKLEIRPTGHIKTSEWGERAIKVELEERSTPLGRLMENVTTPRT